MQSFIAKYIAQRYYYYDDHFSPNLLVEDDAHSSLGHIEHTPSLPMIKLVRHTLLKCTITLHTFKPKNQI